MTKLPSLIAHVFFCSSFKNYYTMSAAVILDQQLEHMSDLCTYISQIVTRLRLMYHDEIPATSNLIRVYEQELLSMSENVEGSLALLESLLIPSKEMKPRYVYTREELLKRRTSISTNLSEQMKDLLKQKINYESQFDTESCRNIRTILIE